MIYHICHMTVIWLVVPRALSSDTNTTNNIQWIHPQSPGTSTFPAREGSNTFYSTYHHFHTRLQLPAYHLHFIRLEHKIGLLWSNIIIDKLYPWLVLYQIRAFHNVASWWLITCLILQDEICIVWTRYDYPIWRCIVGSINNDQVIDGGDSIHRIHEVFNILISDRVGLCLCFHWDQTRGMLGYRL